MTKRANPRIYRRWTAADDALMFEIYETKISMAEVAARFDRQPDAIWRRAVRLGLSRPRGGKAGPGHLKPGYAWWTPANDAYLREMYGTGISMDELIVNLGHPLNSIYKRANGMGLRRSRHIKAAPVVKAKRPLPMPKPPKAAGCRPGWGPNDPPVITPQTIYTIAPPPPAMVWRTNTHAR